MSASEWSMLIQSRRNRLIQSFNTTVTQLQRTLANNFRLINSSRRLNTAQKRQQINALVNQYNATVNALRNQLNSNLANLNQMSMPSSSVNATIRNKRALLIGINYTGTSNALYGCINDVLGVKERLLQNGFSDQSIRMLTDNTSLKPTKANIINELKALLSNGQPGDLLFLMYSGHGSYTLDRNGDERNSRYDQMIIPLDMNVIVDDELKSMIQTNLKSGVTLFAMFDSCFSGSVLDLRYQYMDSLNYDQCTENEKQLDTNGQVLMVSGCTDYQTSVDAFIGNQANGAMTWSLLETLRTKPNGCTWREMVKSMRNLLRTTHFDQIPQFSSGAFENIDTPVFI